MILCYNIKLKGKMIPNIPNIPADGFILAIQTKFQKELYEKYGHSILCIDATHGTNAYRFMLITCIVPDEYGRGILRKLIGSVSVITSYIVDACTNVQTLKYSNQYRSTHYQVHC